MTQILLVTLFTWHPVKFALVLSGLFSFVLLSSSSGLAAVLYVDVNSANPIPPYTNWATAAAVIQDAVDAATSGDTVFVTNGIYSTGGRQVDPYDVTNRVALTNGAIVQSVNGPSVTIIRGYQVPSIASITNAVRCLHLANNSVLSGFTLTNGSSGSGNYANGGGALCTYEDLGREPPGVISNCVFSGNYAVNLGGGSMGGTLINCLLAGNYGRFGGGAGYANLINCVITNNSAGAAGGVSSSTATNCLVAFNRVTNYGGASTFSTLVNCTVVSNVLQAGSGASGGGSYYGNVYNSILFGNTAPSSANYFSSTIAFSCTTPLAPGAGNFTDAPIFVNPLAGDFRMQSNSPCINAGRNALITTPTDLDGNPRISGGTVDVGAYEFQNPSSIIAYYWLQNFGLPTDGTADFADPDDDGMSTWSEWRAGTDPTNALSVFRLAIPAVDSSGITLTWPSASGISYYLQRATNLSANPALISIKSNIVGQAGTTSYKDTSATGIGPYYYRLGVQ